MSFNSNGDQHIVRQGQREGLHELIQKHKLKINRKWLAMYTNGMRDRDCVHFNMKY